MTHYKVVKGVGYDTGYYFAQEYQFYGQYWLSVKRFELISEAYKWCRSMGVLQF